MLPQHVAETHRRVLGRGKLGEHLDDDLADPFGSSHDVGGPHRLVGGDQHHFPGMVFVGRCGHVIGAQNIVLHRLVGTVLHQGHMLVSRRVADDLRPVEPEDLFHPLFIPDRADEGYQIQIRIFFLQLQLDAVGIVFVDVQNDQLLRVVQGRLTAELAADGTASPGNQDHFVLDICPDLVHFQPDGIPAQQILDLHFPEHGYIHLLVHHLVDAGQHQDLAGGLLADLQQFPAFVRRQGGNGDDNLFYLVLFHHGRNVFLAPHYRDALKPGADLFWIIVDDAGNLPVQVLAVFHFPDHHEPAGSGPHHHGHNGAGVGEFSPAPVDPQKAVGKPWNNHQRQEKQGIDDDITSGHHKPQDPQARQLQAGGDQHRENQISQFHDTGEAPETGIHPE